MAAPKTRKKTKNPHQTRRRILNVAEQLFADRGFKGTNVRDLAEQANCNLAAVNYHFGGKNKLYTEVWRRLLAELLKVRQDSIQKLMQQSSNNPSLEQLFRSFAYSFIGPFVDEKKSDRLMKLMAREMLDQHLPAEMFIDEVIRPTITVMGNALNKACPELAESKIFLVLFSLVGQLIHMIRIKTMFGQQEKNQMLKLDTDEMIDHIVKYSVAGIAAYTGGKVQ